ncbi:MAG: PD-(D/E)XK nuclease family protein [Endomicrobiia bacterium]|nr:PD-(D/E)XK nuclease family protein [Endomicrobiia bacterium]
MKMNVTNSALSLIGAFFKSVTISYSKMAAYDFCPVKYKLIYVNGWKVPPNPYISLGLTVHAALDNYHKRGASSLDELMSIYDEIWVNLGFKDPVAALEFHESGKKMLSDFFAWDSSRVARGIKTVYSEKSFYFTLGRHKAVGIIDRVDKYPDGSHEVIDYKTHRDAWSREKTDSDLQLSLYSAGLKKTVGIRPSKHSYYFLYRNDYVTSDRGRAEEKKAMSEARRVADAIALGDFAPRSQSCPKCDFKEKCPESSVRERGKR